MAPSLLNRSNGMTLATLLTVQDRCELCLKTVGNGEIWKGLRYIMRVRRLAMLQTERSGIATLPGKEAKNVRVP
ncbi:MAG: hypothetical protein KDA86_17640 [Planctomycetaceae bacterium]|nr:hypothetical protein [Planctomycetaceae bacterium]